ncbi:hypothetical protein O181_001265 [Austropuccinia psidii MF-1]|uniref:Integrase catalytic domain-containing protein n=1 Tax=Austropuccinia psidii MF-1 TaxID=1389203 RepID=A0A9Q3BAN3_9BASI|nr:hypothetical protein [Austropuccinia psidii MF-1]
MRIQIKESKSSWETDHIDWAIALPPGGDRIYNACLVLVDRCRKEPILSPFHRNEAATDTAIVIWSRDIRHASLFQNITSDRDPKFTSA